MFLEKVINMEVPLYAHTPEQEGERKETLQEHIERCLGFYRIFMEKKGIGEKFERIYKAFGIEHIDYMKEVLQGVIELHDSGKINPLFQKNRMKNDLKRKAIKTVKGENHALLSSILYLDYFHSCLTNLEITKEEEKKICLFLFMNAYMISRHHGNLTAVEEFITEFQEGGQAELLVKSLEKGEGAGLIHGLFSFTAREEAGRTDIKRVSQFYKNGRKTLSRRDCIFLNVYMRLLYSLLTTCDYYATAKYKTNLDMEAALSACEEQEFQKEYEKTELIQGIRRYEQERERRQEITGEEQDINVLRTELFLEAEKKWKEKKEERIFFLEAPTGSGKSNCAVNLSLQMLSEGKRRIWYVYPFNTLVEQNYESLKKIYGEKDEVFSKIAVINSITPMKKEEGEETECYQKALLDRQFLNYPFALTTHVSFFKTLFSEEREAAFGFLQLADSVVVMDEIQSYRNEIWTEIMEFLKAYAEILDMKVIIMSATLPNLEVLTEENTEAVYLISNREKYYNHKLFQDRVKMSYELLGKEISLECLLEHILQNTKSGEKILLEFITKRSAEAFYKLALESGKMEKVYCLTGDDNMLDRKRILREAMEVKERVLLIATQVVEAGVDIDMNVGYKDISILDSEEQFMGRINRSCKKAEGRVSFFHLDNIQRIYTNDIRTNEEFTLKNPGQQEILRNKRFEDYYRPVLQELLKKNKKASLKNVEDFFETAVGDGDFRKISERMKLIDQENKKQSVFFARKIFLENGEELDGWSCWEAYEELLKDSSMDYAKKQYELSVVRSKMNYFIYQVDVNADFSYSDKIGDLYAIRDGEQYFTNNRLDREKLAGKQAVFL